MGIGLVNTSGNGTGPLVITQDFGSQQNEGPQIVGVVYNDPNHTGFYAPAQGLGGVTINVVNLATGQTYQTQTWSAGGYQVPVASNADYQVTATQNGQVISSQQVHVGDVNAEVDFVNGTGTNSAPQPQFLTMTTAIPTATAHVTPAPTPPSQPAPQPPSQPAPQPTPTPIPPTPSNPPTWHQTSAQVQATNVAPVTPPANPGPPAWLSKWSRWTAANAIG